MSGPQVNILIVDDEPKNLRILNEYLIDADYHTVEATDGVEAWSILQQSEHQFDAILLDRMMPNMDGMEVLKKIKEHPDLKMVPVIMQTAAVEKHEILEGLQAGCYYYLTKPFEEDMLMSIVRTAVADYHNYRSLQEEMQQHSLSLTLLESGLFRFRTLDEGRTLTRLLAAVCPDPTEVAMGLSELFINAVEHGNLGISYTDKSRLLKDQEWEQEVERRLGLPEYVDRYVTVEFEQCAEEISFVIKDQGEGFEWQQYLEISTERATDSHGRGIAMASMLSFDDIEYRGNGNEVKVSIHPQEKWIDM